MEGWLAAFEARGLIERRMNYATAGMPDGTYGYTNDEHGKITMISTGTVASRPPTLIRSWAPDLDTDRLYAILKLRVEVFVVEQAYFYPELDGFDLLPRTRHFWLERDGEVIGTVRLLEENVGGEKEFRVTCARAAPNVDSDTPHDCCRPPWPTSGRRDAESTHRAISSRCTPDTASPAMATSVSTTVYR